MSLSKFTAVILVCTAMTMISGLQAQDTLHFSVFFDYNKVEMRPEERIRLDSLISAMGKRPVFSIRITGNTDVSGSVEYNQRLSGERARQVYDYLAANGMKAGQLEILSQGKSLPRFEGTDEQSMALNRRCDLECILGAEIISPPVVQAKEEAKYQSSPSKSALKFAGEIVLRGRQDDNGNYPEIRLNSKPVAVTDLKKIQQAGIFTMTPAGELLAPALILDWQEKPGEKDFFRDSYTRFEEPLEVVVQLKPCACKSTTPDIYKPVKLESGFWAWEKTNDSILLQKKNRQKWAVIPVRTTEPLALMCKPDTKKRLFIFKNLQDITLKLVYTRAKVIVRGLEVEPGVIEIQLPDIQEIPRVYASGFSEENAFFVINGKRLNEIRHNLITGEYVLRQKDFRKKAPQRLKKVDRDEVIFGFTGF